MPHTIGTCDPPGPDGVRSNDELVERLRLLRAWAGMSLRELHRRVIKRRTARGVVELPSLDTVHRCLRTGRTRLDAELVVDIAAVLLGGKGRVTGWRQAVQVAAGHKSEATAVMVSDALPDDVGRFVGRSAELRRILAAVTRPGSGRGRRPVAAVVDGMPGVGKTTLTVRAAHRLARDRRFEHVLWVNLRGHDPDRPPADPAAVLDGFLRRLGIPGSQLAGLEGDRLAAAYRDLLTRRQVLVVLDNAAGDDQIRPLLADGPGSVTLVTSRRRLTGIPASRRVALGVFERSESVRMLGDILGPKRIDAEPAAAAGIAAAVGDLPLAVSLVSARIRATPDWSLADHLDRLEERSTQLRLDAGIELALTSSYDGLAAEARQLLRLLGLHPGRDLDGYAAAALLDAGLDTAERRLAELHHASLLRHSAPGRYEFHDLVRLFAASLATDHDPKAARHAAVARLLDHYGHTAMLAMDWYTPIDSYRRPRVADPGLPSPRFDDRAAAVAWLDVERANLVAAALHAAAHGRPAHTVDQSETLFRYLDMGAHGTQAGALHEAARRNAEGTRLGRALNSLGVVRWQYGRYDEALELLEKSATLQQERGNPGDEARALGNAGSVCSLLGRHDDAIPMLRRALLLDSRHDNPVGEAYTCGNLGAAYGRRGQHDEALAYFARSLAIARDVGSTDIEVLALTNLGSVCTLQGRHAEALEHNRQALRIADEAAAHSRMPVLHEGIATALRALGDHDAAEAHHREALRIATEVDDHFERARAHEGLARCAVAARHSVEARQHRAAVRGLLAELGVEEMPPELQPPEGEEGAVC